MPSVKRLGFGAVLGGLATARPRPRPQVHALGLLAQYEMVDVADGVAPDSTGNGHDATVVGSPSVTAGGLYLGGAAYVDTGVTSIGPCNLFCGPGQSWSALAAYDNTSGSSLGRSSNTSSQRTFFLNYAANLRGTWTNNLHPLGMRQAVTLVTWDGTDAIAYTNDTVDKTDTVASTALSVGAAAEETDQRIILGARNNGSGAVLAGEIYYFRFYSKGLSANDAAAEVLDVRDILRGRGLDA